MSTFGFLESERLLGKVVLLQNSIDPDVDCPLPALSRLQVEGLFANQILPYLPRKLCPSTVGLLNVMMVNGGLTAPQSPARLGGRAIDPSLVCVVSQFGVDDKPTVFRGSHFINVRSLMVCVRTLGLILLQSENPPPCNEHYLMKCSKGVRIDIIHKYPVRKHDYS